MDCIVHGVAQSRTRLSKFSLASLEEILTHETVALTFI